MGNVELTGMRIVNWYDGVVVAAARMRSQHKPVLCVLLAFDPNRRDRGARLYGILEIAEGDYVLLGRGDVPNATHLDRVMSSRIDAVISDCINGAHGEMIIVLGHLEPDSVLEVSATVSVEAHRAHLVWNVEDAVKVEQVSYWKRVLEAS